MKKAKAIKIIKRTLNGYPQVISGYLFGSVAENINRLGSDIDVAILLDQKLDKMQLFSLELGIGEKLEHALKVKTDLIVLNRAPLAIAFRAIKGVLLIEKNPVKRALFESKLLSRYYDNRHFFRPFLIAIREEAMEGSLGICR